MRFSQPFRAFVSLLTILCFSGSAFSGLPQNTLKNPFVILIQENHSDPGSQKRIADLIHYYQSQMNIPLLAVEGASGEIPVEALRKFPDSPAKRKSIEILMDQLILDGASAAAIFSPTPVRFIGVEDPDLYQRNLKVFREAKNNSAANEFLNKRRKKLNQDFKKISPGLKKFYEAGDDFGKLFTKQSVLSASLLGNALPVSKIYSVDFLLDHPEIRKKLASREFEKNLTLHSLLQIRERLKQELIITDFDRRFDLEKIEFEKLENISNLKAVREDLSRDIPRSLSKAREFYDLVRDRDTAMAENLIRNLRTSAILVTGGFHTAGIAQILRSKGISCRILTPKTTELSSNDTLYERRLAGDLSVQTLAAPRAVANSEFRAKLIRMWAERAVSVQAVGESLGKPIAPQILHEMYPENDRYAAKQTSHGIFMETDIRLIEAALNELNPAPGMRVLDLGAGDGRVVAAAALRGLNAVGIEGDDSLASNLRVKGLQFAHLRKPGGIGNVSFEKGDFYQRSFLEYDIIFYSMGGTPDEAELEKKIIRELKPGARFVVFTHVPVSMPIFKNLKTIPLNPRILKKDRMFQIYRAPFSTEASASSLGRRVEKILVVGGARNCAELIKKMAVVGQYKITKASGIEQAFEEMKFAFASKNNFDLVISFLQVEDDGWFSSAATAERLYDVMKKNLGVPPPLVVLATENNIKDQKLFPVLATFRAWDKDKPEGFFGYFIFGLGHFLFTFEKQIINEIEGQYAKQEPAAEPKPAVKRSPSSRRLSPEETATKDELKKQLVDAEAAEKLAEKVEKIKKEREAAEAKRKQDAAEAALELRFKALQEEEAAEAAAVLAEKQRAQVEAAAIEILENPVLPPPAPAETVAADETTPPLPLKWGQGSKGDVGEERSDSPPVAGASLGKASLDQANRAAAWFNRADRVEDSVVFLVRKQTLAELTSAERNEINYHLSKKSRRLLILHEREDKDLNLFGLEGRVQHWWGSAEDYVQVLRRVRAPHVVYLSGAEEKIHFQEPGVVNVKHALFAPTAAVEYLFQGQVDFYGIWKKENGRLELILSEKVEMLFKEIAARRWMAVSA